MDASLLNPGDRVRFVDVRPTDDGDPVSGTGTVRNVMDPARGECHGVGLSVCVMLDEPIYRIGRHDLGRTGLRMLILSGDQLDRAARAA